MAFVFQSGFELIQDGFGYPESPKWLPGGDILMVDIQQQSLLRVAADGTVHQVAKVPGGPNGVALGPDGKAWIANNGGFEFFEVPLPNGQKLNIAGKQPKEYRGGSIDRVDLDTGVVETIYRDCGKGMRMEGFGARTPEPYDLPERVSLRGPDDLVFDASGGFWFPDFGKMRDRDADVTGIYYARPDRHDITEMIFPALNGPNGIALSPKEDRLYCSFTWSRQVLYWELDGPGRIRPNPHSMDGSYLLTAKLPGQATLDSMSVDEDGNVYVAVMLPEGNSPAINGGIAVISPDGRYVDYTPIEIDSKLAPQPSNLCFGGEDRKTLYVTCGASGMLVSARVHIPGLKLNFNPYT